MKRNYRYAGIAVVILIAVVAAATLRIRESSESSETGIVATFYPLYDMTRTIAGEHATVTSLIPPGTEPHGYEPSPQDILALSNSKAFVTMGLEFEHLEEELIEGAEKAIFVINATENVPLIEGKEHGHEEDGEEHAEEEEHGLYDPHIWLSPKNMVIVANNIAAGLKHADSENADDYETNREALVAQLEALDAEFNEGLASCKKEIILVSHNAFSYLAHDYGFETIAIAGLSPEAEPTPQQLARLIEEAREHDIKYVFYEENVDPRVSETIAAEVGAQTLELNPLEGGKNPNDTYITLMRKNLNNLKIALECS